MLNLLGQNQFEIRRSETLGPSAGKELFGKALKAIALAMGLMLVYLTWRFKFLYAVCAIIPLLHDVTVSLGIFFLTGREFSLPIVAAVLTIIGYSGCNSSNVRSVPDFVHWVVIIIIGKIIAPDYLRAKIVDKIT